MFERTNFADYQMAVETRRVRQRMLERRHSAAYPGSDLRGQGSAFGEYDSRAGKDACQKKCVATMCWSVAGGRTTGRFGRGSGGNGVSVMLSLISACVERGGDV